MNAVRVVGNRSARRCMLLGANPLVAAGGLGAPVAREVGLIVCLIELHGKGLDPLPNLQDGVLGYR